VNVPQAFPGDMKEGLKATLQLPGMDETFQATLLTTSNSVSEQSRTALIQLLADNPDGKLWPGAFAEVHFHIPSDPNILRLPATALFIGLQGMQVAKVGAQDKVVLDRVQLGRNLGNEVEIVAGVAISDRIIDNPPESFASGETVRIASAPGNGPAARSIAEAARPPALNAQGM
jgi:membrane fusion protein (multidrug efflux system)